MENTTNQQDKKGHDANIVLAVSGLTFNDIIETLTEALREINQYEYGQGERYENETYIKVHTVREALKAAGASSAVDKTVSGSHYTAMCKYQGGDCKCTSICLFE
jgi:hypothetical protein